MRLVEASDHIMGSFDEKLISYTTRLLENRKVSEPLGTAVFRVIHLRRLSSLNACFLHHHRTSPTLYVVVGVSYVHH